MDEWARVIDEIQERIAELVRENERLKAQMTSLASEKRDALAKLNRLCKRV